MPPKSLAASPPSAKKKPNESSSPKTQQHRTSAAGNGSPEAKRAPSAKRKGSVKIGEDDLFTAYERVIKWPLKEGTARLDIVDESQAAFEEIVQLEMVEAGIAGERANRALIEGEQESDYCALVGERTRNKRYIQEDAFFRVEQSFRKGVLDEESKDFMILFNQSIYLRTFKLVNEEPHRRSQYQKQEGTERLIIHKHMKSWLESANGGMKTLRHVVYAASSVNAGNMGAVYRRSVRQRSNSKVAELEQKVMREAELAAELSKSRDRTWAQQRQDARNELDVVKADISLLDFKIKSEKKKAKCDEYRKELEAKTSQMEKLEKRIARHEEMDREEEARRHRSKSLDIDPELISGTKSGYVKALEKQVVVIKQDEQILVDENIRRMLQTSTSATAGAASASSRPPSSTRRSSLSNHGWSGEPSPPKSVRMGPGSAARQRENSVDRGPSANPEQKSNFTNQARHGQSVESTASDENPPRGSYRKRRDDEVSPGERRRDSSTRFKTDARDDDDDNDRGATVEPVVAPRRRYSAAVASSSSDQQGDTELEDARARRARRRSEQNQQVDDDAASPSQRRSRTTEEKDDALPPIGKAARPALEEDHEGEPMSSSRSRRQRSIVLEE